MIDLHTHSNASDGEFLPRVLIEKAARIGIKTIALTDHDTVFGLAEAEAAAKDHGICFIPGAELEIDTVLPGEFHLLGLGLNHITDELNAALIQLKGARERRNLAMIEKIHAAGISVDYEEIKSLAGHIVGRPHFGTYLVNKKIAKNHEQAFHRWLAKGRPFFVPKEGLEFEKAVHIIHACGGIAILAHPMSLYVSWGQIPGLVTALKE